MNEKSDQDLERQLSEMLTDGEMQKKDREKEERRLLSEIRDPDSDAARSYCGRDAEVPQHGEGSG